MIIEYAGITFNGTGTDDNGAYWYVTELEGWDGPEVRRVTVDPTSEDGTIVAGAQFAAAPLGVKILCKAPNEEAFWLCWNYILDNTANLEVTKEFVVHEGANRVKMDTVTAQRTRIRMLGGLAFESDLSLEAPKPIKTVL